MHRQGTASTSHPLQAQKFHTCLATVLRLWLVAAPVWAQNLDSNPTKETPPHIKLGAA